MGAKTLPHAQGRFGVPALAVLVIVAGTIVAGSVVAGGKPVMARGAGRLVDRVAGAQLASAAQAPGMVAGCPRSLWRDSDLPAVSAASSGGGIEVGVKFRVDRDGYVTGIRFYKGAGNTGTHVGHLWSWNGEKLAEVTFTSETASGWQQASFGVPVRVSAGATFVAAYYAPAGHYAYTYDYFASAARVRAPLTALRSGADGGNGVYRTGSGFPSFSYRATNYWVDPVLDTPAGESCPHSIWTDTQVPGTPGVGGPSSVELGVKFRANTAGFIQGIRFFKGSGDTGGHIGRLWTRSGQLLAQARFAAESPTGWQQVWFAQPVGISPGTTYVASYYAPNGGYTAGQFGLAAAVTRGPLTALADGGDGGDGGNGVYAYGSGGFPTSSYHASNYAVDVLFTTVAAATSCPCSIWPATAEPRNESSTDVHAVEVGVRFAALRSGYIKGIRFYKAGANTGSHIGRLWSTAGVALAEVSFTGETVRGWQQALFSSPVAVTAGTVYVASYYAPAGHYAFDDFSFATDQTTRGPLTALAHTPATANGVYRYGAGFPTSTYQSTNYWVDVVYEQAAPDTTPPTVVAQWPPPNATAAAVSGGISATFSEAVTGSSIAISVHTAAGVPVSGSTSYEGTTRTARFTPSTNLDHLTDYIVSVSGARDGAGNTMAPATWMFTTALDPSSGPGGPIGVITSDTNPYSSYYAEILRAEGLNEFSMVPVSGLTAATLNGLAIVILADLTLSTEQVATLTAWVTNGGRLIAMSPDPALAPLLGLSPAAGTLSNAYLAVDNATPAGAGITAATMQFHGTADRYTLAGATMVARLYSTATSATTHPAVSTREVGPAGGRAAAFTYDLARSVVLTRQGNPAWAGQERDGITPIRSNDMFFGGSNPDWIDLDKVAIPQADEQQRLLTNLIETLSMDRLPLPRFWYLPGGANAVVVATGDDEAPGTSGTSGRFDRYLANSPPGCDPTTWTCLRFTSYLWPTVALTNAQARAYHEQGFEVALHPENGCSDFTASSLEATYTQQLTDWQHKYHSIPPPQTSRYHCISFSDWDSQPKTELRHGIRLDTNYYYWPGTWIQDRPGFMTGSGIPMRFTDTTGHIIDVYQAATVMTDESGQSYPYTPDTLLDHAFGEEGYYGVFVANMHDSNKPTSYQDDQLVASAQNHGVPVTTAREMLHWLDSRAASSFQAITSSGTTLTFTINPSRAARNLQALLPTNGVDGTTLSNLTHNGTPVNLNPLTIKGIEYTMFAADPGTYTATYAPGAPAVTAATATATPAGTATLRWTSNLPGTTEIAYGTDPTALTTTTTIAEKTRKHTVHLPHLTPHTTYYYRVTTTDTRGNRRAWPSTTQVASFTTPAADTQPPAISDLHITPLPDSTVRVTWHTDEPSDSTVDFGTTPQQLDTRAHDSAHVTSHIVVLADLDPNRQYHLRVTSTDRAGNNARYPAPAATPTSYLTSPPGVADQTRVSFRTGTTNGALAIQGTGLAHLTLSALTGTDGTPATGTFTSRILNAHQTVTWHTAQWDADATADTRLTVKIRSGNTPTPDASWSAWTTATQGGQLTIPASRYLQYHIDMTASQTTAPVLHWIAFTHNGPLPGSDRKSQHMAG